MAKKVRQRSPNARLFQQMGGISSQYWQLIQGVKNKRLYFVLALSLLPICGLIWSGYAIVQEFILGPNSFSGYAEGELFPHLTPLHPVAIMASFYPGDLDENGNVQIQYSLGLSIVLSPFEASGAVPMCLRNVFMATTDYTINGNTGEVSFENTNPTYVLKDPLCGETVEKETPGGYSAKSVYLQQTQTPQILQIFDYGTERYFPFDAWETKTVYLWADIANINGEDSLVRPRVLTDSSFPDWDSEIVAEPVKITINGKDYAGVALRLKMQRPLSVKIMNVVLLIALFGFITLLLFINENSSALEVGVGILLGLWGVQEILVPPSVGQTTLMDSLIQLLYVYFAAIACLRFVTRPISKRLRSN